MNPQDPLAELRDLANPEAISMWPPAPGWWVLACLLIVLTFVISRKVKAKRYARAYRLEARDELMLHWRQYEQKKDSLAYLSSLNLTLKRTALSAFPASGAAASSGEQWLKFLDSTLPLKHREQTFQSDLGQVLVDAPYRKHSDEDPSQIHALSLVWIQHHQEPEVSDA